MEIERNDWRATRLIGPTRKQAARMSADEPDPTVGNLRSGALVPRNRTRYWKRYRTARKFERRIAWEPLLLGGMGVAVAILSAVVILEIAAFGARFVSSVGSTM